MLATILYVVSIVGLSTILSLGQRIWSFNRNQKLFRFRYSETLDVVLTTDWDSLDRTESRSTLDDVKTQLGYIEALAHLTTAVTSTRASKPITVHVSEGLGKRPEGDLIILGGSGGNFLAGKFLDYLKVHAPGMVGFDEDDQEANWMSIGDTEVSFNWKKWRESEEHLTDFALIVMWINPFATKRRRAVWCSGFTAAGTSVAAAYVKDSLLKRWKEVSKQEHRRGAHFPCFAVLLAIDFKDQMNFDVSELNWLTLDLPHLPLSALNKGNSGKYWSVQKKNQTVL